jgi:anaerobic dimethyl sulfoxide reductase subunit C
VNVREWALPLYTILMQLSVGALLVLWLVRHLMISKFNHLEIEQIIRNPMLVIAFTCVVAMMGAHFHLSKPFHSFLAVLNFRSSWLSREIVFTILFFITTCCLWFLTRYRSTWDRLITIMGWVAILIGCVMVYCMARIYLIPTQAAWNSTTVIFSFYGTMLLLGSITIACLLLLDLKFAEIQKADDVSIRSQVIRDSIIGLTLVTLLSVVVSIGIAFLQIHLLSQGDRTAQVSLQLLLELYMPLFIFRLALLIFGSLWLGYAVYRVYKTGSAPQELLLPLYLSCLLILAGEIIGRFLFYATHVRVGI